MENKITTLTNGQHIIFGLSLSKIVNEKNWDVSSDNMIRLASVIQNLDDPKNNTTELTPSEAMEEYPSKCYDIFCDFWNEHEEVLILTAIQ